MMKFEEMFEKLTGHSPFPWQADLARLYGATTKRLNEQVKRNLDRFPPNFVFPLARTESRNLKCQSGTSGWGGGATSILRILRPHLPMWNTPFVQKGGYLGITAWRFWGPPGGISLPTCWQSEDIGGSIRFSVAGGCNCEEPAES